MTEPATAAEAVTSPPPAPAFYESFQDAGVKEWATTNKFSSAEDVAKLAHKFDAFKDADPATLRALPKADANAEDHVALLREMGAPSEAKAYALTEIKGVDPALAGAAQEWFAEAGLLPWQAQKIAAKQMEFMTKTQEAMVNEERVAGENELAQVKTEWGQNFEANREHARRALAYAAKEAGLDGEASTQLLNFIEQGAGTRVALKMAAALGKLIKEGDFIDGKTTEPPKNNMASRWYPPTQT